MQLGTEHGLRTHFWVGYPLIVRLFNVYPVLHDVQGPSEHLMQLLNLQFTRHVAPLDDSLYPLWHCEHIVFSNRLQLAIVLFTHFPIEEFIAYPSIHYRQYP